MSSTVIMIIMICLGCAAALGGLAMVAVRGFGTVKTAQRMGVEALPQIRDLNRKVQELAPRLEQMASRQKEVAERLESLSATAAKLDYLRDELDAATGHVSSLKS
jgi:predicted nuclease with TOPRIM domain